VDTNVVKNTIFHYNIECLLSDNTKKDWKYS